MILMIEIKGRIDISTPVVQAKAAVASRWCKHASDYSVSAALAARPTSTSVGGKPWRYLLVPHDEIVESLLLSDFLRYEVKS